MKTDEQNKRVVLEAFDTLFNKRDYAAAERFWSPDYIQHSAHIGPGREGLFNLIKSLPPTLKYEPGTIVADGEFVILHGRFSGFQPVNSGQSHYKRAQFLDLQQIDREAKVWIEKG
jgi:predicted SnoaL-like aldol condensation-catalyzing enzyme